MSSHEHTHDEHHSPHLQHHFESLGQQFDASKLGMWLFLATEILLFGGLFCGYAIWRARNPELFQFGSEYLDTWLGATNTCVLILSSMTMAMAVTYAQMNRKGPLVICLALTLAGAAGFMVIKYFEYTDKFEKGIYPGVRFYEDPPEYYVELYEAEMADREQRDIARDDWGGAADVDASAIEPPARGPRGLLAERLDPVEDEEEIVHHHMLRDDRPADAHMFFNIYFMMTGLHGIHVIIGGLFIMWLLIRAVQGTYSSEYFTPVDLGGLYWHVVDLIWIFLFPLFYLI